MKPVLDLQTDGNRIYKSLRNYVSAVRGKSQRKLHISVLCRFDLMGGYYYFSHRHARSLKTPRRVLV